MHPSRNIAMLKENVHKPGNTFDHYKQTTRMTMAEYDHIKDATMFVEEEEIRIAGQPRKVRRLYVKPQYSEFIGVGWIINEDITNCMVCGETFGMFRWPHHCRSCGNLVCHPCSPESVEIVELKELGEVRVCVQCYWGQHPVHAAHIRKPILDEDIVEEEEEVVPEDKPPEVKESPTVDEEEEVEVEEEENKEASRFKEEVKELMAENTTPRKPDRFLVIPVPSFCLFTTRKLSSKEMGGSKSRSGNRVIFVNICMHEALENYPVEVEFVVSEDIYSFQSEENSAYFNLEDHSDRTYEIYHVILRPELLSEDALQEDEEQCTQVIELKYRILEYHFLRNCLLF